MEKLFIADASLTGQAGHYVEYVRSLTNYGQRAELQFRVLANRMLPPHLLQDLCAEPVFRQDFWHRATNRRRLGFFWNPLQANWVYFCDISRALRNRVTRRSIVFVPTVDHHQMLACAWWLASLPVRKRPQIVLLFRYTYFPGASMAPWRNAWWLRLAARVLAPFLVDGRVRYVTDSQRLARQYQNLLSTQVAVVPIPHTVDIKSAPAPSLHRAQPLRFAFLGDAREEKGFAIIVEALSELAARAPTVMADVSFLLQCQVSAAHWPMAEIRERLRAKGLRNVTLIDQTLSRQEYCALLAEMDVALLPYLRDIYYARTSGPFTESLAAGKPVVATADTWMSDELGWGGAGLTVEDRSINHLIQRIEELHATFPAMAQLAYERQGPWRERHNPGALMLALAKGLN